MEQKLPINPWLKIWVKPRQVMQALMAYSVKYRFIVLSAIYGFLVLLHFSQVAGLGERYTALPILIVSLILCIPVGWILLSLSTLFVFWFGKLIRGKATYYQTRLAVSWANVPHVLSIGIWIILLILYGKSMFMRDFPAVTNQAMFTLEIAAILQLGLNIWAFIIFLFSLGEVQKFSAWMALLNVVLVGIVFAVLGYLSLWGLSHIGT